MTMMGKTTMNIYDGNDNDDSDNVGHDDNDECKKSHPVVHFLATSRLHAHLDKSRENKKQDSTFTTIIGRLSKSWHKMVMDPKRD